MQTVLDLVLSAAPPLEGDVVVVSDDHIAKGTACTVIPAHRLRPFLEANARWFINRDLVLIAPEQRRIVVIHHEGAYAHIQANAWVQGAP